MYTGLEKAGSRNKRDKKQSHSKRLVYADVPTSFADFILFQIPICFLLHFVRFEFYSVSSLELFSFHF